MKMGENDPKILAILCAYIYGLHCLDFKWDDILSTLRKDTLQADFVKAVGRINNSDKMIPLIEKRLSIPQ